jgi:hypothetical protein
LEFFAQRFLKFSALIVVLWIRSKACNVINKSNDALICSFYIPNFIFILGFLFSLHLYFFFFYHLIYLLFYHFSFKLSSEFGLSISLSPMFRIWTSSLDLISLSIFYLSYISNNLIRCSKVFVSFNTFLIKCLNLIILISVIVKEIVDSIMSLGIVFILRRNFEWPPRNNFLFLFLFFLFFFFFFSLFNLMRNSSLLVFFRIN